MKSYYKILTALLISLSLFLMIEIDVFHHHSDGSLHNECPICVLNTVVSAITILSAIIVLDKPLLSFIRIIPLQRENIKQNYSSYYYPDRAPPRV
jgi:hypothetical protein